MLEIKFKIGEDNYTVTSCATEYTLIKNYEGVSKTGTANYNVIGHFTQLKFLVDRLFELKIRYSDAKTFDELLDVVRRSREWIREIFGFNVEVDEPKLEAPPVKKKKVKAAADSAKKGADKTVKIIVKKPKKDPEKKKSPKKKKEDHPKPPKPVAF